MSDPKLSTETPPPPARGHEATDADVRNLVIFFIALVGLIVVGLLLADATFRFFVGQEKLGPPATPYPSAQQVPPPPRLEETSFRDNQAYRAQERHLLETYGWVDRKAGTVRIPIDRAMDLLLQRGLPVRNKPQEMLGMPGHPLPVLPTRPQVTGDFGPPPVSVKEQP